MDAYTKVAIRKLFFKIRKNEKELKELKQKVKEIEKYIETVCKPMDN